MHVVFDGLPRGLLGGGKQRPDIDVEADIGERRGDHLLAAVVAVLADLGDQDARPAALGILERVDQRLHFFDPVGHGGRLPLVDAGDGFDFGAVPTEHLFHRIGYLADGGLARAASIASANRLPLPSPALRVSAASASSTSFWLRSFRKRASLSICSRRTVEFPPSARLPAPRRSA